MADVVNDVSALLNDDAAAVVLREPLSPVEGPAGVFFPPTFAATEDKSFLGGYNIDKVSTGNVCLIDSVGSQANRIEPIFMASPYADLVPQVVVEAGEKKINLLEAGHRAGDAIVRCSELQDELNACFRSLRNGDAEPLALIAPTSLVFGVWDSRDTQAKAPRLLMSTIRARRVSELTRSAVYNPVVAYIEEGLLEPREDDAGLKLLSKRGFHHALASKSHGGIVAEEIHREATLQLAALRLLRATSPERTAALRSYLLGLALVAMTRPVNSYLRQGCNLVPAENDPAISTLVMSNGKRTPFVITHEAALAFAKAAASKFGVGKSRTVKFDKERAAKDAAGDKKEKTKGKGKAK